LSDQVISNGKTGAFSPGVEQPAHESDDSPPSCVEVKNAWSYTSTPPNGFTALRLLRHREKRQLPNYIIHIFSYVVTSKVQPNTLHERNSNILLNRCVLHDKMCSICGCSGLFTKRQSLSPYVYLMIYLLTAVGVSPGGRNFTTAKSFKFLSGILMLQLEHMHGLINNIYLLFYIF
jgi:hypothetical protein